jgi:hypothetical protein
MVSGRNRVDVLPVLANCYGMGSDKDLTVEKNLFRAAVGGLHLLALSTPHRQGLPSSNEYQIQLLPYSPLVFLLDGAVYANPHLLKNL